MVTFINEKIEEYCSKHSSQETILLEHIRKEAFRFAPQADMCSDQLSGAMLKFLIALHKPLNILEIGCFFGYATLCIAESAPNANITCLEWDGRVIETAKNFIHHHPCKNTINIIHGDANKTLDNVLNARQYDFIFIDADKKSYENYVKKCFSHLKKNGVLIVDNALWKGNVLTPKNDKDSSVHYTNLYLKNNLKCQNILIPIKDGMHCAIKTHDN